MGREYELKYRATPEQLEKIRSLYGDFEAIAMETTYFDTPRGIFSDLHWTLRLRMENGRSVCTLKVPLDDGSRGEWETECPDILSAIPELCKLGCPEELRTLAQEGLHPACGARFTRLAKTLADPVCTVELALDQGCLLGGGRELPFAEVEVEYKSGSETAAAAFAQALAWKFGLTAEPKSKIARARALAFPE